MSDATTVDLAKLLAIVAEEMLARQTAAPRQRCQCHGEVDDCCPVRFDPIVGAGATRLGYRAAGTVPSTLAQLIDHTLLKPDATAADIEQLCREAAEHEFATVCVHPCWVRLCAARLRDTSVGVCAVVGFPLGATLPEVKRYETERVIELGAREVDTVINIGALKSGDWRAVERDLAAVTEAARRAGAMSKAIIEAAYLTDEEKVTAATLVKASGADFVKTSTGFGPSGATVADVALLRKVVGADLGVKAAGGVRDLATVQAMVAAGATRVGASAGVRIVRESAGS